MKILVFVLTFLFGATALHCKIIYYDFKPDSVLVTVGMMPTAIDLDLNKDGTPDFYISHHTITQFFSGFGGSQALTYNPDPTHLMPTPLNDGDTIKAGCSKWYDSFHGSMNMDVVWPGLLDKCIGLRFKVANKWRYGWIRISVPADGKSCIVKEYAYEDTPDAEILAGATGSSSIKEMDNSQKRLLFYPNPSKENIAIENAVSGELLQIYDIQGNIVKSIISPGSNFELSVTALPPGIYFIGYKNSAGRLIISR